jgi:hypothetical protein
MTPDEVFRLYRGYKFFYAGTCKFTDDGHPILKHPPLLKQYDRAYYWRLAQKCNNPTIHALFTIGFFHNPRAHISDLTQPAAIKAAFVFAGRGENGATMLAHDLYDLARPYMEPGDDKAALLNEWLYGIDADGNESSIPEVLNLVTNELLPLDLACLLLLIPQPALHYDWPAYWATKPDLGLGAHPWIARLKTCDQLLRLQRPNWRAESHRLAREFWESIDVPSLAPITLERDFTF